MDSHVFRQALPSKRKLVAWLCKPTTLPPRCPAYSRLPPHVTCPSGQTQGPQLWYTPLVQLPQCQLTHRLHISCWLATGTAYPRATRPFVMQSSKAASTRPMCCCTDGCSATNRHSQNTVDCTQNKVFCTHNLWDTGPHSWSCLVPDACYTAHFTCKGTANCTPATQ